MLLQIIVLWRRNTFASCTGRHTTTNTDTLRKSSLLNSEVELVPRGRYYKDPDGEPIKVKEHIKDLGITFSSDGSFDKHIQIMVAKAKMMCGWSLRVFDSRDVEVLLPLFRSFIIPLTEYCSPLWFPTERSKIASIEKIQRAYTKKCLVYRIFTTGIG